MQKIVKIPTRHIEQAAKEFVLLYKMKVREYDYVIEYILGKEPEEIAKIYRVKLQAVRTVLLRAKKRVKVKRCSMLRCFFLIYFNVYMEGVIKNLKLNLLN